MILKILKLKKSKNRLLGFQTVLSYFPSAIVIDDTFIFVLSSSSLSSVPISMLLTLRPSMNLLLTISATSTALEIAFPLALMRTSGTPLLNCVITPRT